MRMQPNFAAVIAMALWAAFVFLAVLEMCRSHSALVM
jgi:hypothetical protein